MVNNAMFTCIIIMNSLLLDNINNNDDMQLDKVIDTYFDHELNPLTECNINSSYYDIETLANSRNAANTTLNVYI